MKSLINGHAAKPHWLPLAREFRPLSTARFCESAQGTGAQGTGAQGTQTRSWLTSSVFANS